MSAGLMSSASDASALGLIGNYTVTFSEDGDERERVLGGSSGLVVLLEQILKLRGPSCPRLAHASCVSVPSCTAAFADHFCDGVTCRVGHACLLANPFLFGEIGLQVVLSVIFELAVQILVFKLDALFLFGRLALEVLATLVPSEVLLDDLRCLCLPLLSLLVQFVEVSLGVDNARHQFRVECALVRLVHLLVYHGAMRRSLLHWHFVS